MSTQAELVQLLDGARSVLHSIEDVAVSDRNRVEEGIQHAVSAAASMTVTSSEPVPVEESAVEASQAAPVAPVAENAPVAEPEPVEAATVAAPEAPKPEA